MFDLVRRLFQSAPAPSISHPVFGELVLKQGAKGPYWLHETFDDVGMAISIETHDGELPSEEQVQFFRDLLSDEQALFERVRAKICAEHEKMHRKGVPSDWKAAFKLAGIGVPLDGIASNPWDFTYECLTDGTRFLYTCHFEGGELVHVSVDT